MTNAAEILCTKMESVGATVDTLVRAQWGQACFINIVSCVIVTSALQLSFESR